MKEKTSAKNIAAKGSFALAFSVGSILFSAHAGGGFATGNQANTYYVGLGWLGPISAVIAMLLLTLTMREAMIMYNSRGLKSHKELFETLYHPLDKCYVLFEVFFYIMVLMAVAAAISGAASALNQYFGLNYYIGIVIVGALVLLLTIFGADLVRKVSTYMGIAILVTAITIYTIGIFKSKTLFTVMSADFSAVGFKNIPKAILNAFTYAGFQMRLYPLEKLHLGQKLLVAGLAVLFGLLYALVHGIHVSEYQLYIYGFHVADGVYRAVHVDYVFVLKAANYVDYGVHLPYMGKELVAQALAPVCAAHKAGYVNELY